MLVNFNELQREAKVPGSRFRKETVIPKRTWGGIKFTFREGVWYSESGIELRCASALRSPLSDHWSLRYQGRNLNSGMSAEEAVKIFLKTHQNPSGFGTASPTGTKD
jgi:hypothetical protein